MTQARIRYRFLGRVTTYYGAEQYIWESVEPVNLYGRHERIQCPVDWFWGSNNIGPWRYTVVPAGNRPTRPQWTDMR